MQMPIIAPEPIVSEHAEAFKDLFENQKQYRHLLDWIVRVTEQKHGKHQPLHTGQCG